ncbi:fibroblast growth factor receptor 3-like isoform X2 [Haliotis rufescens]|uniref:fibroblast growth factor receptor 3-like isoform X2 n=1 Tax=Haliotis rufescens TaxID=6454 RepID=UPI001EAF9F7C|nr:fibroblast growth factor receptor 3-like isoform X2 [Haliotis rufescens]
MRLRVALLVCCLLVMLVARADGKCRKKKGGKKCEKASVGPPRWRRRMKETVLVEREQSTVVLKCQARANPRPRYRWYRSGNLLNTKKSKKYRRRSYRLTINSLQMADSGQYTCTVYNTLGSLNRTFTLRVLGSTHDMSEITVKERPRNQTAKIGDTVVFGCSTDSFPRPTIEWSRKKGNSPRVDILQKPSTSRRAEMFVLDRVTKDDVGLYTCTIKNKMSSRQLTAKLAVIREGEELPFEPKCALHIRKEYLYDSVYGCKTSQPVKITYCMGSCGRSEFTPLLVLAATNMSSSTASTPTPHINQTCNCCVGQVQSLRVVSLDCPSGGTMNGFFTTLGGCVCRSCKVEGGWGWAPSEMGITNEPTPRTP